MKEKCPKCGARNPESTHYCEKCGNPLSPDPAASINPVKMAPIPKEETNIGWNYPLGEISFLNKNQAEEVIRLKNVQTSLSNGILVLSAQAGQFMGLVGVALALIGMIGYEIRRNLMGPNPIHLPSYAYGIITVLFLFILFLLYLAYRQNPSVAFDSQAGSVEFFTGQKSRYKVSLKDISQLSVRSIQRSGTNALGRGDAWTAWSLYLKLKNGQEIPVVELDTEETANPLSQQIQKEFLDKGVQ
jgi:hypothetical protein